MIGAKASGKKQRATRANIFFAFKASKNKKNGSASGRKKLRRVFSHMISLMHPLMARQIQAISLGRKLRASNQNLAKISYAAIQRVVKG